MWRTVCVSVCVCAQSFRLPFRQQGSSSTLIPPHRLLQAEGKVVQSKFSKNAWPADRNAWITKLADKSCCPLPLPLLKLPMTKFFLAVMGFQAGETFYQRWACE